MVRLYKYVGPSEIAEAARNQPAGTPIKTLAELRNWLRSNQSDTEDDGAMIATFTVNSDGVLHLAPRRTEHVACASGGPVKSAGEMVFAPDGDLISVSNQSTGFCPEPASWIAVAMALDGIVTSAPRGFSNEFTFRRCPACSQILVIKDRWFVCDICDADVPTGWNFE